ncbi:hypothetical protein PROFUN_08711 [Planoprotostelium fungivorum]|uniref:Uncharacterized protein n=1 Tax=Planoprotostelium fungivorum TaxID=1890364 RepID=A0A2P6MQV4_9EUKA|nr:hypothetical protein PROFUN_08711 [Planoprotostelium fungivorum]
MRSGFFARTLTQRRTPLIRFTHGKNNVTNTTSHSAKPENAKPTLPISHPAHAEVKILKSVDELPTTMRMRQRPTDYEQLLVQMADTSNVHPATGRPYAREPLGIVKRTPIAALTGASYGLLFGLARVATAQFNGTTTQVTKKLPVRFAAFGAGAGLIAGLFGIGSW